MQRLQRFFFIVISPVALIVLVQLRARLLGGGDQVTVQQVPSTGAELPMSARPATAEEPKAVSSKEDRIRDANQLCMLIIFLTYP